MIFSKIFLIKVYVIKNKNNLFKIITSPKSDYTYFVIHRSRAEISNKKKKRQLPVVFRDYLYEMLYRIYCRETISKLATCQRVVTISLYMYQIIILWRIKCIHIHSHIFIYIRHTRCSRTHTSRFNTDRRIFVLHPFVHRRLFGLPKTRYA